VKGSGERREIPDGVIIGGIIIGVLAIVGAIVWGIIALVGAATGPGGQETDQSVSWQCTQFGDRLYWPTGYGSRGFAVVPGGCRP
jgi:hypothetical protein